jgi:hypothetical protein
MLGAKHGGDMTWLEFIRDERTDKLEAIEMLSSGRVQLHMTTNGVRKDITDERLAKLKEDVAEIEQILTEEGIPYDA